MCLLHSQVSRRSIGRGVWRTLLISFGVVPGWGQVRTVTADLEFDLGSKNMGRVGRGALLAQRDRLVFVEIGERAARIKLATPDGVIQSISPDIVNVHEQIYKAMPLPDGNVWIVASGPHAFGEGYGVIADTPGAAPLTLPRPVSASGLRGDNSYVQLDLYTPGGKRLDSARIEGTIMSQERPIGVWSDGVVFWSVSRTVVASVSHGQVREIASAPLTTIRGSISLTTPQGKVIVIERSSGRYAIGDSPVMQLARLKDVIGAAFRDGCLCAMGERRGSKVLVVKGDVAYECVMRHPFRPQLIDASGTHIYLADFAGRGERFSVP